MDGRDVKLKIKVDDSEVTQSTESMKRLKAAASDTGKSGSADLGKLEDAAAGASGRVSGLVGGLGELGAVAGAVAAGAAAIAAALVVTGVVAVALFNKIVQVSKAFADYVLDVGNAAEASGLATATMSALTAEADAQGRSISGLDGIVSNFRKTIGEAAAGSEDARAKLKLLGIDGSKAIYDVDSAFKSALVTILKAPAGFEQMRLGAAAFGDDFYKLLPFFSEFRGNIDGLIAKADELGIVLGGKDVAQAREFTRAYEEINSVIKGLKTTFVRDFLPDVIKVLKEFVSWLHDNKDEIKEWAVWGGSWVSYFLDKLSLLANKLAQIRRDFQEMADMEARNRGDYVPPAPTGTPAGGPIQPQSFGITPNPASAIPDPQAMAALVEQAQKMQEEREKAAKAELAAQIKLYEMSASNLGKAFDDAFGKITERFKETLDIGQYQANWDQLKQWYGAQINDLVPKWEALVAAQTAAEKKGATEQEVIKRELADRVNNLTNKTLDHDAAAAKAIAEVQKKQSADYLKNLEAEMNRAIEIRDERNQTGIANQQRDLLTGLSSERAVIEQTNKLEMDSLTFRKAEMEKFLAAVVGNKDKEAEVKQQIAVLDEKIAQQTITNNNRITDSEIKKQEALNKILKAYEDYKTSLEDQLFVLQRGGQPLTVYEQTMRDLQRDYKDLDPVQKQNLLNIAAEIDAVTELNRQHAELKEFFKTSLRYVFDGNFKGLFQNIQDRFKDMFADKLADIFATSVLGFNPNQTNNPVAKPIVKSLDKTNEILNSILVKMGGTPVAGAGAGAGGIGGVFNSILGGFGGGNGPGGTPNFNSNAGGGIPPTGTYDADGNFVVNGNQSSGGGILGNLKNLFSTGPGGIFAPQKNILTGKMSGLGGIIGGIGSLASLAGGLIGGRFGSVLSLAGTGASLGAMFGPIGAIIGGVGGAILGLFGINKQRRADERSRAQALASAESAIKQEFESLMTQLRFGTIDSASAINQAASSSASIRQQYIDAVSQLKDGKTRRIALSEVQQRIDPLIAQKTAELKGLAEIAAASAERSKRILPEFAGGTYIADFFRPNGLIPGIFDGRDDLMAMLTRGEMVLNPMQQQNVRANAGFDVFAGAGIPNYPRANPTAKLAVGGIANTSLALSANAQAPTVVVNPTIVLEGVAMDDKIDAYLISDRGERTQIKVQKKLKKSGDI